MQRWENHPTRSFVSNCVSSFSSTDRLNWSRESKNSKPNCVSRRRRRTSSSSSSSRLLHRTLPIANGRTSREQLQTYKDQVRQFSITIVELQKSLTEKQELYIKLQADFEHFKQQSKTVSTAYLRKHRFARTTHTSCCFDSSVELVCCQAIE